MRIFFLLLITLSLYAEEPLRVIISGGPGVGKTSILLGLEQRGYDIVTEAAADTIRMDLARNISTPWAQEPFQRKVLELQMLREKKSLNSKSKIIFYDRSPFDTRTYLQMRYPDHEDLEYMQQILDQLKQSNFYHHTVFIIENFEQCVNDDIRHESLEESIKISNLIESDYIKHGFHVVRILPGPLEERIDSILNFFTTETEREFFIQEVCVKR